MFKRSRINIALWGLVTLFLFVGCIVADEEDQGDIIASDPIAATITPQQTLPSTLQGAEASTTPTATLVPTSSPVPSATPTASPTLIPTVAPTSLPSQLDVNNIERLQRIHRYGRGSIQAIVYSPDQTTLAVGSSVGVYLYDLASMQESRFIETTSSVNHLAFSPDGASIAIAMSTIVKLVALNGDNVEANLLGHDYPVLHVAFSPDGSTIASGDKAGIVSLWRTSDNQQLRSIDAHIIRGSESTKLNSVDGLVFTLDSQKIATASSTDPVVKLWQTSNGDLLHTLDAHTGGVYSISLSPDGATMVSGSFDQTAKLWQIDDGQLLYSIDEAHFSSVTQVVFSSDGKRIATGAREHSGKTLKIWRASDGQHIQTLDGGQVHTLAYSPDGKALMAGSPTLIQFWSADGSRQLQEIGDFDGYANSVSFSSDSSLLVAGLSNNRVKLWQVNNGALEIDFGTRDPSQPQSIPRITDAIFSPDDSLIGLATNGYMELKQVDSGSRWKQLEGLWPANWSIAFSPDGSILAGAAQHLQVAVNVINLWDVESGQLLKSIETGTVTTLSLAHSPNGTMVAVGFDDNTAGVWRVSDGQLIVRLGEAAPDFINAVAFSPDNSLLATGSADSVKVWQIEGGNLLHSMDAQGWVDHLDFSPDGSMLAVGSSDRNSAPVKIWQVNDGSLLTTLQAGGTSVAFSPDGTLLATNGEWGTVAVWAVTD